MIIYFSASVSQKERFLPNYLAIINLLRKQGHQVISDHIIEMSEGEIAHQERQTRIDFHEKVQNWIQSCDFMIAETSFPSTSIGYEVAHALRVGKPVLVLYSLGEAPSILGQHKDEKLVCEKYTLQNLQQIISHFVEYVEGKTDLRFTFFITPKIAAYLDETSRKDKIPKSVYLRKLIEADMHKRSS